MSRKTLLSTLLSLLVFAPGVAADRPHLHAALDVARWLKRNAIQTPQGKVWAADPGDTATVATNLYSGSAGIVLFFIEAFRSTGDTTFLDEARAGADYLLADLSDGKKLDQVDNGLYTGVAGLGYVLGETYKVSGDSRYRAGMQKCAEMLQSRAEKSGGGVVWLNHEGDTTYFVSDIIGGSSGAGLFLLYAARELQDSTYRELAASVGHRLVEAARDGNDGSYWAMDAMEPDLLPMFPRLMPNFSHGTSGIAFFLATLYQETGQREFLDAALRGARYLQAVAKRESDAASIFHHEPDGKDLYYLGWCHGPVGTARLFHRLYRITGDMEWMEWVKKFARADLASGIPERQTPGFWNNVSQCCGSAGVAEFFLSLYRITNEKAYIDFARRLTENLLGRVTSDDKGMRWIQAEHRVKPELLVGQTGYMQGAAGIGMWLLHFDAFEQGKQGTITLPDSPF